MKFKSVIIIFVCFMIYCGFVNAKADCLVWGQVEECGGPQRTSSEYEEKDSTLEHEETPEIKPSDALESPEPSIKENDSIIKDTK